ncbi:transposase [Streptomyces sp. NPDC056231]|uniref:transposase n=1 Tax=Streptomyces sp. NPDC056231 TaxID=3345755 RepID=UPI003AAF899B
MAPLLPVRPPRKHRHPGGLPVDDRAALRGIVYVLCKSASWRDVPAERVGWRRNRVRYEPHRARVCAGQAAARAARRCVPGPVAAPW